MATQAADIVGQEAGEGAGVTERDFEKEAREHGWTPQEDFKGDPSKWVDAKTFVERADVVLPLLKKKLQGVTNDRDSLKRDLRALTARFETVDKRAYDRAMADIEARMDAAAEVGDREGVKKAREDMKALTNEAKQQPVQVSQEEAQEAYIDFREQNPWYDRGGLAKDYADVLAAKHANLAATMRPAEYFEMIAEKVRERYGDRLDVQADDDGGDEKPRRRVLSPVEGANRRQAPRGAKTFANLPPEAQRMAERFVRQGILKDKEDYAKTYQWD